MDLPTVLFVLTNGERHRIRFMTLNAARQAARNANNDMSGAFRCAFILPGYF